MEEHVYEPKNIWDYKPCGKCGDWISLGRKFAHIQECNPTEEHKGLLNRGLVIANHRSCKLYSGAIHDACKTGKFTDVTHQVNLLDGRVQFWCTLAVIDITTAICDHRRLTYQYTPRRNPTDREARRELNEWYESVYFPQLRQALDDSDVYDMLILQYDIAKEKYGRG